jgi:squalene-hopene/tetraprenyl-beta-curcumene cyclase
LLQLQRTDGHWVGELQGDTILESEYILLMAFLGREGEERIARAARYILKQQMLEGGWSNYPGGPADVSVSVKAYFALKLAGHAADEPYMRRARAVIRGLGGASGCNSFSKFYLALLGQFPYDNCPAVAPEMLLQPRWSYLSIYAMSSWTRTIIVPLSIFCAYRPVRHLPEERGIRELFWPIRRRRCGRTRRRAARSPGPTASSSSIGSASACRAPWARSAASLCARPSAGCSITSPAAMASGPSFRQ